MVHHQNGVPAEVGPVPQAPRRPTAPQAHEGRPEDGYAWLRDVADPAVLAYLEAEQTYYERATAGLAGAREQLAGELTDRAATVATPRWRRGDGLYVSRTPAGERHPRLYAADPDGGPERLLFDPGPIAAETGYLRLGDVEPSPDGRLLAYAVDVTGGEAFEIRFRDPATGATLPDRLPGSGPAGAFGADGTTFFYAAIDGTGRAARVRRHRLGTPVDDDVTVAQEPDPRFELSVRGSRDGGWVVVRSASPDTSWVELIDARRPDAPSRLVAAPRPGVSYDVEPMPGGWDGAGEDLLLIVTDDEAPEFRLMTAPLPGPGGIGDPADWRAVPRVVAADGSERLESVCLLWRHLVLSLRADGEPFLRVIGRSPGTAVGERTLREVHAGLPFGQVRLWRAEDPTATRITVLEQNLVTAPRWVEVDLATGERTVVARTELPGVDPTRYVTERLTATSADGTAVPVTIARPAELEPGAAAGALLLAHGAHEVCSWPAFALDTLSLLDRGVVVAVAHPRGGGELGRRWWRAGRGTAKPCGADDLLAARDALVAAGWAGERDVVARGRSAGALLPAVAMSRTPDRFAAVVAELPLVDVVSALSDADRSLSPADRAEWQDALADPAVLAGLRHWSPYDNVPGPGRRPALLVTGALHDARVLVHEPARWVARLREADAVGGVVGEGIRGGGGDGAGDGTSAAAPLLFRVEFGPAAPAGPPGGTGGPRYEAEILAWVLHQLGDPGVRT